MTIDQLLYQIRRADGFEGLIFDAATLSMWIEQSDEIITLDALVIPFAQIEREMEVMRKVLERTGNTVKPLNFQVTPPHKQRGLDGMSIAVVFELSDGQTISIYLHNPDVTPNKIAPTDSVISWKWLLNKKDITIVVAPERGEDIKVNEVGRRVMLLAEKNSLAFQRANTNRADKMKRIQTGKDEIVNLEKSMNEKLRQLEVEKLSTEERMINIVKEQKNRIVELKMEVARLEEELARKQKELADAEAEKALKKISVPIPPPDIQPEQTELDTQPEGRASTVKTAKGTKIETGFTVVEADRFITSHDVDGQPNPLYPEELQPRDRKRDTSVAWVKKTAKSLDPDSLGKTSRADTGAPIVGKDMVVESGNGRAMAIKEAYRIGKADEYRQWLMDEADVFGINPEKIKSMKKPVLVRVRTSEINRRQFAIEANQDDKLAMTATEKANADTDRLTEELISKMSDDGDLTASSNRGFISGFLASLGDSEAAQYITSDGAPTRALIDRVQSAVFAKAYDDDRLLEMSADVTKPEVANVINALNVAAPEFVRARMIDEVGAQALSNKVVDSIEVSLNKQAVDAIIGATNLVRQAKQDGRDIKDLISQQGLFGNIPPAVAAMALFINNNNRSSKRLGVAFAAMAKFIRSEAERGNVVDMFGANEKSSLEDIIKAANLELDKQYGEGAYKIETADMFSTVGFSSHKPVTDITPEQPVTDITPEPTTAAADEPVQEPTPQNVYQEVGEPSKQFDTYVAEADGDLFKGAKDYFKAELQGKIVKTVIGDVHLTGAGFKEMKRGMKSDGLKASLITHVPSILSSGRYDGRSETHKERTDGFIAFHFFEKEVAINSEIVTAGVNVGERDGYIYEYSLSAYGLGYEGLLNWKKAKAHQTYPGMSQEPGEPKKGSETTLDSSVNEESDGINIIILKVVDKDGVRHPELEDGFQDVATTESVVSQSENQWSEMNNKNRLSLLARAGWATKSGAPNTTAKKMAKQDWEDLEEGDKAEIEKAMEPSAITPTIQPPDPPVKTENQQNKNDIDSKFDVMVKDAAKWKGAVWNYSLTIKDDKKALSKLNNATSKADLDAYLMRKYGVNEVEARDVSNTLTARNIQADLTANLDDYK